MPYNPLADNSELTAAHLLAEVYNQVISQVTSASRPGAPAEGQVIYETDTDRYYAYSGTGWVQFGAVGAWTTYTPVVNQPTALTFTNTYSRYIKIGRMVTVHVNVAITSAGTANTPIHISVPTTGATGIGWVGTGIVYDSNITTVYPGLVVMGSTTHFAFTDSTAATTVNTFLGQTGTAFAAALASGDVVSFTATYEAAA